MFGFLLTSVFFFFVMRQRSAMSLQRDTAEISAAKDFINSYADYIEKMNLSSLTTLESTGINYNSITGTVTRKVNEIVGIADSGADPVSYNFGGSIFVEWNKCSQNMKGDIVINGIRYPHDTSSECLSSNTGYDDIIGPITVSNPFTVQTMNTPLYFKITSQDSLTVLLDNKWTLDIKTTLDYGKVIEVKRSF